MQIYKAMKTYGFFLMFVMGLVAVSCNQTSGSIQEIGDVNVDIQECRTSSIATAM